MNSSSREGWPQSQGQSTNSAPPSGADGQTQSSRPLGGFGPPNPSPQQQQPSQPSSAPPPGPVLPPPSNSFFTSNSQQTHNLPTLAGLTTGSGGRHQPSAQESPPGPQPHQAQAQGPAFSLPSVNQAVHAQHSMQAHSSVEQDRERDARESRQSGGLDEMATSREAEQREREARERQLREQPPHETHAGSVHLHQPVAVAPNVRAIHGPNGILGNPGASGAPNLLAAPLAPFHQPETTQRMQQPTQSGQQNLLVQFSAPGGAQPGPGMNQAQQPILNDALSYLDQVKVQFADHPDVYNRFLDIMKDFKSGAIDTPGVIERVSHLFAGNPGLIQGFNTFLPPGYKIECGAGDDPNAIRVTTPMGTTVSTMPPARPLSNPRTHVVNGNIPPAERSFYDSASRLAWPPQQTQESSFGPDSRSLAQTGYGLQTGPTSHPMSPEAHRDQPTIALAHQPDQRGVSQLQNAASVGAGIQIGNRQGVLPSSPGDAPPQGPPGLNGASSGIQQAGPNGGIEKRGPVEFNHAISYVNKIKNRFAAQPDIYKQFLEILQTYQRESKPIQEVYAQVTRLFETAPDLLEDFKQFLPESAAQAKAVASRSAAEDVFPLSSERTTSGYAAAVSSHSHLHQTPRNDQPRLPPMGNFAPTPSANRDNKRKRGERQGGAAVTPTMQAESAGIGSRAGIPHGHVPSKLRTEYNPLRRTTLGLFELALLEMAGDGVSTGLPPQFPPPIVADTEEPSSQRTVSISPSFSNHKRKRNNADNISKRAKYQHTTKQPDLAQIAPVSPALVPPLPQPLPPTHQIAPTLDELSFFDRVRKHVGNKSQYTEFLKLINLFTQDLCSANWLVFRAQTFIGNNPELYNWFKRWVGAEPEDEIIENQPLPPSGRVALSNCRGLGPSYRLLPRAETLKPCSGRDDLCRFVLNDEWASHPTWASEDSGFVAHRKNQFEEGLHRIEEERHDYDTHLGACDRSIQLLEPIAQQLATLTPDQRRNYKLSTNLGGQSETIYRRTIFKIYGREKGSEVITLLFRAPYDVIPTLLARMKQKREEWKAAQREWNKVWRMQTNNTFWRSLDHQGAGGRQSDKRQYSTKALQSEILVKDEEQRRLRESRLERTTYYQFEMQFEDTAVLYDCVTLLLSYIDHRSDVPDSPKLPTFVKEFAANFFGIDQANMRVSFYDGDTPLAYGDDDSLAAEGGLSPRQKPNGRAGVSLLRDVLERGRTGRPIRRDDDSAASDSRASSPDPASIVEAETPGGIGSPPASESLNGPPNGDKWLNYPTEKNFAYGKPVTVHEPYQRTIYNMYANWSVYFFFRLFSLLYERLLRIKDDEDAVRKIVDRALQQKPADMIGWVERHPTDCFKDTSPGANYYSQMLQKFEDHIKDPSPERSADLEDTLRRHYLYTGWPLYHCDKLVSNTVKHASNIIGGDSKDNSWNIYQAFKKDRAREETTHDDEVSYRRQVEKLAKDSEVLRIAYNSEARIAQVKLLHRAETTFDGHRRSRANRWRAYIASWQLVDTTEEVDPSRVSFPFVRRNATIFDEDLVPKEDFEKVDSEEKMMVRVDVKTYVLQFEPESSEWVIQKRIRKSNVDEELAGRLAQLKKFKMEAAMEKFVMNNEWMKGLSKDEVDTKKDNYNQAAAVDDSTAVVVADSDDGALINDRMGEDRRLESNVKFDFEALPEWASPVEILIADEDEDMEGTED